MHMQPGTAVLHYVNDNRHAFDGGNIVAPQHAEIPLFVPGGAPRVFQFPPLYSPAVHNILAVSNQQHSMVGLFPSRYRRNIVLNLQLTNDGCIDSPYINLLYTLNSERKQKELMRTHKSE